MKTLTMGLWAGVLFATGVVLQFTAIAQEPGPESITAHVPGTINYQGRLVGLNGAPYTDATYSFDIRLYKTPNGGTPLWGGTYTAFVKDGYFNITLGGTNAVDLAGTTYTSEHLWKALWPDPANGAPSDSLYLGITSWQGANGSLINLIDRTELSPRQTLLTAPYAFRAQTAEYADQAASDFVIGGNLTVPNATEVQGAGHLFWKVPGTQDLNLPMGVSKYISLAGNGVTIRTKTTYDCDTYTVMVTGIWNNTSRIVNLYTEKDVADNTWTIVFTRDDDGASIAYAEIFWVNKNWMDP